MLAEFPKKRQEIAELLSYYYGELQFSGEIGNVTEVRYAEMSYMLQMRNVFSYDGGEVCVEFPSMDAGAWLRCYVFAKNGDAYSHKPTHVVCVFDSEEDMEKFFVACDYEGPSMMLDPGRPAIYGLYLSDLYEGNPELFIAAGPGNERGALPVHRIYPWRY